MAVDCGPVIPGGARVNDRIDKEMCSLSYTSVDAVVERILDLGKNALLAKLDIKQAYRMVPVHPQDRLLLGMEWEEYVYVDKALPVKISTNYFHGSCRRPTVDHAKEWSILCRPLH